MDIVILSLLGLFATARLALGVWHACKPLPAALHVEGPWREARASFERHWHNRDDDIFSRPYAEGADASTWRYWRYRSMEASGWSLF